MPADITSTQLIAGVPAIVAVALVHFVVPIGFASVCARRAIVLGRRARDAAASWVASAPIAAGASTIRGTVEYAQGSDHAVQIEIEQVGRTFSGKNGPQFEWKEYSRRTRATPFYVREERGQRIRVEPDDATLLVDMVDREVRKNETTRLAYAELTPGEAVWVVGELAPRRDPEADGAGYRGGEATLAMVPPQNGRLLVSTEPLDKRFADERGPLRVIAGLALAVALLFAALDVGFFVRLFEGQAQTGVVSRTYARPGKNAACLLVVETENGERLDDAVAYDECARLEVGDRVPVVWAGSADRSHVGSSAGVSFILIFIALVMNLGIGALFVVRGKRWYEGAPVEEQGTGPLLPPVPK